jgi:hypothetical protein
VGIRGTHFTIPIVKERVTDLLSDKMNIGIRSGKYSYKDYDVIEARECK